MSDLTKVIIKQSVDNPGISPGTWGPSKLTVKIKGGKHTVDKIAETVRKAVAAYED